MESLKYCVPVAIISVSLLIPIRNSLLFRAVEHGNLPKRWCQRPGSQGYRVSALISGPHGTTYGSNATGNYYHNFLSSESESIS